MAGDELRGKVLPVRRSAPLPVVCPVGRSAGQEPVEKTFSEAVTLRLQAVNANGASTDSAAVTFTPIIVLPEARPVPAMPLWALLLTSLLLALVGRLRRSG